jgi:hypothetical protein
METKQKQPRRLCKLSVDEIALVPKGAVPQPSRFIVAKADGEPEWQAVVDAVRPLLVAKETSGRCSDGSTCSHAAICPILKENCSRFRTRAIAAKDERAGSRAVESSGPPVAKADRWTSGADLFAGRKPPGEPTATEKRRADLEKELRALAYNDLNRARIESAIAKLGK